MSSEALPTTWKIPAAAGCWLVYLPVAVLLWSKRHLPLFLMAIPLAVMVLFLGVSLLIVTVRAAHLSHVGMRLLLLRPS
jgi:hypothetical protein